MTDIETRKLTRSPSWTPEVRQRILIAIRNGVGLELAPAAGDLSYSSFCAWRRADRQFACDVDMAREQNRQARRNVLRRVMDEASPPSEPPTAVSGVA